MRNNPLLENEDLKMPYREQTAWLTLIAMCGTFGPYLGICEAGLVPDAPLPNLRQMAVLGAAALVNMIVLGIGHLVLFTRYPIEAKTPMDERERDIMRRSVNAAYCVLLAGILYVGCVMPFTNHGWAIVNATIFMVVIAEAVHQGMIITNYRS